MKKIFRRMVCTALFTAIAAGSIISQPASILDLGIGKAPISIQAAESISLIKSEGWLESAYVTWGDVSGATEYRAYVKVASAAGYTQLDDELVRKYSGFWRADALGLAAGTYKMKVEAYKDGSLIASSESGELSVTAYDRSGAAFSTASGSLFPSSGGIGAYKNDGTLKDGAVVVYVHSGNAKNVQADIITNSKGEKTTSSGFQDIVYLLQKGYETRPIDIRILGTIDASDMDSFGSSAEGLQVKGKSSYSNLNLTIEGVGNDAAIRGFGILVRNSANVEFRNFAVMHCMDDSLSLDTDNKNIWIHNTDMFYGQPGGDSDQKKGDGTIDVKADSTYVTISYNHFFDNGKSSLCGMKSETADSHITYHHNWFDHSDSRHPRIRTMSVHIYNNLFDGNSKYGTGVTMGSSAFVESNVFKDCKYPMMSSGQGTDTIGSKGTFSGETGGIIKAYNNSISGATAYTAYGTNSESFDAYEVKNRTDTVPSTVVTKSGGTSYNNFDTNTSKFDLGVNASNITAVGDVENVVKKYAGRGNDGGDFFDTLGKAKSSFTGLTSAVSYDVDEALTKALDEYKSKLISVGGGSTSSGSEETTKENVTETTTIKSENSTETTTAKSDVSTETTTENTGSGGELPGTGYSINFTEQGIDGSSFYTIKGNLATKKTLPKDYPQYTRCLKMESTTSITFNAPSDGKLYIVSTSDSKDPAIKINGESHNISENGLAVINVSSGENVITKDSSLFIYYIEFVPNEDDTTTTETTTEGTTETKDGTTEATTQGTTTDPDGYTKIESDMSVNYGNYTGYTKTSGTDTVY
ncbi:MAG: hypothetical protein IJ736_08170, partial [Firmicutes bacterium]|nr:hypothetical protein [Bacillota bacterium]